FLKKCKNKRELIGHYSFTQPSIACISHSHYLSSQKLETSKSAKTHMHYPTSSHRPSTSSFFHLVLLIIRIISLI
ncbi:hypothetical protein KSS87_012341, partial [Heliosperma pusillum]